MRGVDVKDIDVKMKAIDVKKLSYRYPGGPLVLQDLSLSVAEGETVGLLGPNGAGKTTLLLCICGVLKFQGEVKIFGKDVSNRTIREMRRKIGFVFQNPDDQLFMPTVYEDISFGPRQYGMKEDEIRQLVRDVLRKFGLEELEQRSSHHLSVGEKKKIALATALVMDPPILIFDEPTAELDPASKREFKQIIKDLRPHKTILISTHDMGLAKELCNRVIVLNRGKIVHDGALDVLNDERFLLENRLA